MERMVALNLNSDIINSLPGGQVVEMWKAIGYLATWAPTLYTQASIRTDGKKGNLEAYYTGKDRRYVIGAIWRDGKYSFHS